MRSLDELMHVEQPAWPELHDRLEAAGSEVAVLPVDGDAGERTLHALQVTAGSTLGALALHTGGVVCDHGWLRLLGAGADGLPSLAVANALPSGDHGPPPSLTIAYDVLGGRFAIDGGALANVPGEVCYFGPDTLGWTPIGGGHTAFVRWVLDGGTAGFYADLRWPGWEQESSAAGLGQGISIYPPPFTEQGRDLGATSRRVVPFDELLAVYADWSRQLADLPAGAACEIKAEG
jgi:hypothetical protein